MEAVKIRALIWPTYSYMGNIGGDSLYIIARNLIRASDPSIMWVLIVPDSKSTPVDDLDEMPNVQKVRVNLLSPSYRQQEATINEDLVWRYSGADGAEPVDAVISLSPHRSLNLANAWSQRSSATSRQMIVTWDLLVRDDGAGEFVAGVEELVHAAAGNLVSDLIVHESPVARKMTLDIARKHLSMSAVRTIMERSVDVMQGISVQKVLSAVEGTPKRDQFTVYYGGRFSSSKRLDDIARVVDYFYRFGRDVDFVVTTGSLDGAKRRRFEEAYPQVELHVGLPQEEAFRIMASCHASLCFSTHELFGMAFWEQMAAGLGVVMLAKSWNEELVPPGYENLVHSPAEAGARLRMMYESWSEGPKIWEEQMLDNPGAVYVRKEYDADQTLAGMMETVARHSAENEATARKAFDAGRLAALVSTTRDALDGQDEITLASLWEAVRNKSDVGRNFIGRRMYWGKSNATLDGLRAARWLGYEDCYIDGQPGLRKITRERR